MYRVTRTTTDNTRSKDFKSEQEAEDCWNVVLLRPEVKAVQMHRWDEKGERWELIKHAKDWREPHGMEIEEAPEQEVQPAAHDHRAAVG